MKLITNILTKNDCYTAGKKITVKGVMVHSTGANNPNLKRYVQPNVDGIGKNLFGNHWNKSSLQKCVHAFIGKLADGSIATVQTLPWDHRGWHGGKGTKGSVNDTHIGFEICEDNLKSKEYFDKIYREAVELTAYLCKMYNLDPLKDGVVICHNEGYKRGIASNHGDVTHWFPKHGKTMDDFREDVAAEMKPKEEKVSILYRVQVGAYSKKSNCDAQMKKLKSAGFDTYVVKFDNLYRVQTGAYSKRANAEVQMKKVMAAGFDAYITTNGGKN